MTHIEHIIIEGFRRGDKDMFKDYFYEYCRAAYNIFDKKYDLRSKENLDFMSLAHQYAIYLMEHNWKPLEDCSPSVSLRTWMINGFRYIVLDALKWYKKEYGSLTFEEYIKTFDTSKDLRLNFNKVILDACESFDIDKDSKFMIDLILVEGFKIKEVASMMGISPSAVSQRFTTLKEKYIIPYFKNNFDMNFEMSQVMDMPKRSSFHKFDIFGITESRSCEMSYMEEPCIIDQHISEPRIILDLAPDEIFVFGSNIRGIHGFGASEIALRLFGAVMGQGEGLQGRSYAIPTMPGNLHTIKRHVNDFIDFAQKNKYMKFLVTEIGCGMAGFSEQEIAPLFQRAHDIDNIILPYGW